MKSKYPKIFVLLLLSIGIFSAATTFGSTSEPPSELPPGELSANEFYMYAYFTESNSVFKGGQGVGGYEINDTAGQLYVARQDAISGYCDVYNVSIESGTSRNAHPKNSYTNLTYLYEMEKRTLVIISSYDILDDMKDTVNNLESIYPGESEFYINETHIFYGPSPGGIHCWEKNPDGTFGAYQGLVVNYKNFVAESLAYDEATNTWYAGTFQTNKNKKGSGVNIIYSFNFNPKNSKWQIVEEFRYEGTHHNGLEFISGNLWVADSISDHLAQWQKDSSGTWIEVNRFDFGGFNGIGVEVDAIGVDGMGFGPLAHFWVTGVNSSEASENVLYELGGGGLQGQLLLKHAYVDVKPSCWPNPISVKDNDDNGLVKIAVCGDENLDVTTLNVSTIKLNVYGSEEYAWPIPDTEIYKDICTAWLPEWDNEQHQKDTYMDLILTFYTQDIADLYNQQGEASGSSMSEYTMADLTPRGRGSVMLRCGIEGIGSINWIPDDSSSMTEYVTTSECVTNGHAHDLSSISVMMGYIVEILKFLAVPRLI